MAAADSDVVLYEAYQWDLGTCRGDDPKESLSPIICQIPTRVCNIEEGRNILLTNMSSKCNQVGPEADRSFKSHGQIHQSTRRTKAAGENDHCTQTALSHIETPILLLLMGFGFNSQWKDNFESRDQSSLKISAQQDPDGVFSSCQEESF